MAPPSRRISRPGTAGTRQAPTRQMDPEQPSGRRTTVKNAMPQPAAAEPAGDEAALASNDAMSTPAEPNAAVKLNSPATPFSPDAPAAKAAAPPAQARAGAERPSTASAARSSTATAARSATSASSRSSTSTSARRRTSASKSTDSSRQAKAERRATGAGSSRVERAPTGRHEAGAGSSRRGHAKSKKGNRILIIIAAVVLLGVIAALSWTPFQRSRCIKAMDAAIADPAKVEAAMKAADDYLGLVGGDMHAVEATVLAGHGPVAVQIHLAKAIADYHLLVSISERSSITPEDRAGALQAAVDVYTPERDANERLPGGMDDWITDPTSADSVAAAAIALIGKASRDDALQSLLRIAGSKLSKPARVDAACSALAAMTNGATCGQILRLYSGAGAAHAVANAALCDAVEHNCGGELATVLSLAFGEDKSVHAFALACLADCHLDDAAKNDDQRVALSRKLHPLLDAKASPDELAGAVKACAGLQLSPCADDLIALAATVDTLNLPLQVNGDFLAHTLGESLLLTGTPASNALTEQLVAKLTAALANQDSRAVIAKALSLITAPATPGLRAALDALAEIGDQASIAALKTLVGRAWSRDDVVKLGGDDSAAWKALLAKDHVDEARASEIKAWVKKNGKYNRVSDGAARLQESADFLDKAMADTTAWLNDANYLPPLGYAHSDIEDMHLNIKMLMKDVKPSLAGAKQESATPAATPAGGDAAPANANPATP